jgi:hypothetical protein
MWTQVVGKLALKLSPRTNHYWNTALQVTSHGLATVPLTTEHRTVTVTFDFVADQLLFECSDGRGASISLKSRPVAEFYRLAMEALARLDVRAQIWTMPVEVPSPIRFDADRIHRAFDPAAARACWQVLVQTKRVLERFRSRFVGKASPIHFWWGSFDLAHTRFSGRVAPVHPGGIPSPDAVTREAYSRRCISVRWWPGSRTTPISSRRSMRMRIPSHPAAPAVIGPAAELLVSGCTSDPAVRTCARPDRMTPPLHVCAADTKRNQPGRMAAPSSVRQDFARLETA